MGLGEGTEGSLGVLRTTAVLGVAETMCATTIKAKAGCMISVETELISSKGNSPSDRAHISTAALVDCHLERP